MRFLRQLFFLTFLFSYSYVCGQGTSNKGKEFWIAYQNVSDDLDSRLTLFITSNYNAVVNISAGGIALAPVNVVAGQAVPVLINPRVYTNTYISKSDGTQIKSGIQVTSDVDIIVYCHISNAARSASSLILPVKALGNEYYTTSYTQTGKISQVDGASVFTLVGVEDNTVVEILPKANSIGNTKFAGTPFQVTLNKGDVYQYKSPKDLTGSKITTVGGCKPLAVFSGSTFISYCEPQSTRNPGSGDPLYQQLFPTSAWGQNFVTAPFFNAQNGSTDIIQIQVAKDNTVITVNGSTTSALGTPLTNPYAAGSVISFSSKVPTIINAGAPISVAQLQVTQVCNINNPADNKNPLYPGDPEMTILNPIEQTLKDITVYSAISTATAPTNITKHYLNIILKTIDIPTLRVDGIPPANNYKSIGDGNYSFITIDVTTSSENGNPAHRIKCENGFTAIAYGYGQVESYAYLAGADLKNLNAAIEFYPVGGSVQATYLCLGENYDVKLKLPYKTQQIVWEFNKGQSETVINPDATPTMVGGKMFYYYNYKVFKTELQSIGNYTLKATVLNPNPSGCDANEEVSTAFDVSNLPVPKFGVDKIQACQSDSVTFIDKSDGKGKDIVRWFWNFGDGNSTEKTDALPFTYRYQNPGDYLVKLQVKGETDCVSNLADSLIIHVAKTPEAKFSQETVNCVNKAFQFQDASIANEGKITSWTWDFGDAASANNVSTEPNPFHTFSEAKTYLVTLIVTTDMGCRDTVAKQIAIKPSPLVDFDAPDRCINDPKVAFANKSISSDGSVLSYVWDFGDNNTSTETNPTHVYSEAKVYVVSLTVTSSNGCVITFVKSVRINPMPLVEVTAPTQVCITKPLQFTSVDNSGGEPIISWLWDFGDRKTSTEQNPSHNYTAVGNYIVTLTVTSKSGCSSQVVKRVEVIKPLTSNFEIAGALCANNNISFVDQSTSTDGAITNWLWDFGDGSTSTYGNPTHLFSKSGTYKINLTTTSKLGCTETVEKTIKIVDSPEIDFTAPASCVNDFVTFTGTLKSGNVSSWFWNFGDGSTDVVQQTKQNPQHKYLIAKTYSVTLKATSPEGCVTTLTNSITINGSNATVSFEVLDKNNLCGSNEVSFKNTSTIESGNIVKLDIIYENKAGGNPVVYTDSAPEFNKIYTHKYPKSSIDQNYQVIFRAYSGQSCYQESAPVSITVNASPELVFDKIDPVCVSATKFLVTAARETTGIKGVGKLDGKGIIGNYFDPAVAGLGEHVITYTFTSSKGCQSIISSIIKVVDIPRIILAEKELNILLGGEKQIKADFTGSGLKYKWTPSLGLSSDSIPNPIASPTETTKYILSISSKDGCTAAEEVNVIVHIDPEIWNVFTPNGDGINDTWSIKYLETFVNASIRIFNRSGLEVFYSKQYTTPWDGRYNHKDVPVGVYYYIIEPNNGRKRYTGSLTLLR